MVHFFVSLMSKYHLLVPLYTFELLWHDWQRELIGPEDYRFTLKQGWQISCAWADTRANDKGYSQFANRLEAECEDIEVG